MKNMKHHIPAICKNDGSVIVPCLMVLVLVTIIGVMSIRTSSSDIDISTNHQLYERAFYAAEAARAFVRNNPVLYGSAYIDPGILVGFPQPLSTSLQTKDISSTPEEDVYQEINNYLSSIPHQSIQSGQPEAYKGAAEYLSSTVPPRGSGFAIVKFRAHNYRMICEGHYFGRNDTTTRIEAGFYRIGF